MSDIVVTIEPAELKKYIIGAKTFCNVRGMSLDLIILSNDQESMIDAAFWSGEFNGFLTHHTDRHGKIRTYLDGVRVRFTDKTDLFHPLFLMSDGPQKTPPDGVTPKVGPGGGGNGGTPINLAQAA